MGYKCGVMGGKVYHCGKGRFCSRFGWCGSSAAHKRGAQTKFMWAAYTSFCKAEAAKRTKRVVKVRVHKKKPAKRVRKVVKKKAVKRHVKKAVRKVKKAVKKVTKKVKKAVKKAV